MKLRFISTVIVIVLLAPLVLTSCAGPAEEPAATTTPAAPPAEKLNWTFINTLAPGRSEDHFVWMANAIRERSNGMINFEILWSGEHPFKPKDFINAIKDRAAEMGRCNATYMGGWEPILNIEALYYGMDNIGEGRWVFEKVKHLYYEPILEEKWNQKYLWSYTSTGQMYHGDTPFLSFDDLKGKKVRVYNAATTCMIEAWNATPVTISASEIYPALQRGVIDGSIFALWAAYKYNFHEVVHHHTATEHGFGTTGININLDAWNELSPDLQDVVLQTVKEACRIALVTADQIDYEAWQIMEEQGDKFYVQSPEFRAQIKDKMKEQCWPALLEEMDPGLSEKIVKAREEALEEWRSMSKSEQDAFRHENSLVHRRMGLE